MVSLKDKERLNHIIKAIDKIEKYTESYDFDYFEDNEMMQDAVFKNLEIIGEAAYKLSTQTKEQSDHIEWRKIEGLRHKLVHDYYQVDLRIVWETKNKSLPYLKSEIQKMISK